MTQPGDSPGSPPRSPGDAARGLGRKALELGGLAPTELAGGEALDPATRRALDAYVNAENVRVLRFFALLSLANLLLWWWFSSGTGARAEVRAAERVDERLTELVAARTGTLDAALSAALGDLESRFELAREVFGDLTAAELDALRARAREVHDAVERADALVRRLDRTLAAATDGLAAEERRLSDVAALLDDLVFRVTELNGDEGFQLARHLTALASSMDAGSAVDQLTYLRAEVQELRGDLRDQANDAVARAATVERLETLLLGDGDSDPGALAALRDLEQSLLDGAGAGR